MYGVVRSWRKKAQIYPWSSPPFSPPLCVWPEVLLHPDSLPSAHRACPSCLGKSCSLGWSPPSHTSHLCLFSCSCFSGAENKGAAKSPRCVCSSTQTLRVWSGRCARPRVLCRHGSSLSPVEPPPSRGTSSVFQPRCHSVAGAIGTEGIRDEGLRGSAMVETEDSEQSHNGGPWVSWDEGVKRSFSVSGCRFYGWDRPGRK